MVYFCDANKSTVQFGSDVIILGDLNAYSTMFGANTTDARGRILEKLMDDHNMVALSA